MLSARNLGLSVTRSSGDEEYVICPWHDDKSPSASYNRRKGMFYCYVCHLGLNLEQLLKKLGLEDMPLDEEREPEDFDLLGEQLPLDLGSQIGTEGYYLKRGIGTLTMFKYGARWKAGTPEAAVLPIYDLQSSLVGVMYRYLHPEMTGTRYKVIGDPTPLWPMPLFKEIDNNPIIVTEGAFSAMRISSWFAENHLSSNCFALLGAKASQRVVDMLKGFSPVFLYDNDLAGRTACRQMRRLFPTAPSWTLSTAPDDMTDEELLVLFGKIVERI